MMYLARYGEYLSANLKKIRYLSAEWKTAGHEALSAQYQWTDIAEQLRKEASPDTDEIVTASKERNAKCHTTEALTSVCYELGINTKSMIWAIHQYAERNTAFHNDLQMLIGKCLWRELAEHLVQNLRELPFVTTGSIRQVQILPTFRRGCRRPRLANGRAILQIGR